MNLAALRTTFMLIVLGWMWLVPRDCSAQWTKSIECPAGRVYGDVRLDAGRDEFCGPSWGDHRPRRPRTSLGRSFCGCDSCPQTLFV